MLPNACADCCGVAPPLIKTAGLHVFLHGMPSQIRARKEAEILVSHGHLRVNLASREPFIFIDPRKQFALGSADFILAIASMETAPPCYSLASSSIDTCTPRSIALSRAFMIEATL